MNTTDILATFLKGNHKVSISEKQRMWLLSQAKRDGVKIKEDGWHPTLCMADAHYTIQQCKRRASGGSYVGTAIIQGRYNLEKMYYVKFKSTGLTCVCSDTDLRHFQSIGEQYDFINFLND